MTRILPLLALLALAGCEAATGFGRGEPISGEAISDPAPGIAQDL